MSGADADELERLGHRMQEAADRLEVIRNEVASAFARTHWDGDDGQHFRDLWQHRLSGLLRNAAVATRGAGAVAVRNAQQQRYASGDDGSGGPAGLVPYTGGICKPVDKGGWGWKEFKDAFGMALGGVTTTVEKLDWKKVKTFGKVAKTVGTVGDYVGGAIDLGSYVHAVFTGDERGRKIAAADLAADVLFPVLETGAVAGGVAAGGLIGGPVGAVAGGVGGYAAVAGLEAYWNFKVSDDFKEVVGGAVERQAVRQILGPYAPAVDLGGAVAGIASGGINNVKKLFGR
ncbi:WXG100 family type VII secretion target [Dactylosporangium sp. NPDC000521]|uniref:WXG100 family type VII secretion target n=1 Tax=Dactylosporangium sp. NPDC000521 TaxID=3363975 RepID=UPI0036AFBA30